MILIRNEKSGVLSTDLSQKTSERQYYYQEEHWKYTVSKTYRIYIIKAMARHTGQLAAVLLFRCNFLKGFAFSEQR